MRHEARPAARRIAKSIEGMPYNEAVFLVDRALDFHTLQLHPHAPEDVVDEAYHEYDKWVAGLDINSLRVIQIVEISTMMGIAQRIQNDRRKGPSDRRILP